MVSIYFDDSNIFRALMPPGWRKEWHCGFRSSKTNRLVAFIGAIPCKMQIRDKSVMMVEINFLCVHKQLRSKRVTPVLVKEITRRVNSIGIFQAAFTAGIILPKPIATSRYWHRSLNPKKLIECGFSSLTRKMTMKMSIRLYKLPDVRLFRPKSYSALLEANSSTSQA
jgi:glycylpeptide N-tetradecanoyltransferase